MSRRSCKRGEANLEKPPAPFATVAIQALEGVRERLSKMAAALRRSTMEPAGAERHGRESSREYVSREASVSTLKEQELNGATDRSADALEHFRARLQE